LHRTDKLIGIPGISGTLHGYRCSSIFVKNTN
jgi:hypothetical protein